MLENPVVSNSTRQLNLQSENLFGADNQQETEISEGGKEYEKEKIKDEN